MNKIILIALFISGQLICQVTNEANQNPKISQNNYQKDSTYRETLNNNELLIPWESFKVFTDPFFIPQYNIDLKTGFSSSNTFVPLGFTSNAEYLIYLNKSELMQGLNKRYQLSKPGTFQQILGMFQVGAAAALAGYHIYKYEIKKEKK